MIKLTIEAENLDELLNKLTFSKSYTMADVEVIEEGLYDQ